MSNNNKSSNRVQVMIRSNAFDVFDRYQMSETAFKAINWFLTRYDNCGDIAEFLISLDKDDASELDF